MKCREQREDRSWQRILTAFAINAAFLTVMLCFFSPMWEMNDDLFMSKFVDGQMQEKTAYVPFVNICLGWFLKTVYTFFGDAFNWYSACQYLVLYLGFTAITWAFLTRFRLGPALVMTAVTLGAFATDCYLSMNFSKPSAVGTVGGMSLMLCATEDVSGRVRGTPLVLGILLALAGYLWRFEEFGVCALLMASGCVSILVAAGAENRALGRGARWRIYLRSLAPFILLAVTAVGLFAADLAAWSRPGIKDYFAFNQARSIFIDFQTPEYVQMPEVYDSVGMDEDFVYLMKKWSFYDTEKFTRENLETLIAARDQLIPRRSPGECLGVFLDKCLMGFTLDRPFAGFALMLVLWLACGKRSAGSWLSLFCLLGSFGVIYMLLIWSDRYLANRVDIGLFLAMAVVLSFQMDNEKLRNEKFLLTAVLILSLFLTWRANRAYCLFDSHSRIEDRSAEKAAVLRLLEDDDHLYFVKIWAVDHQLYSPLETPPAGYFERFSLLGGWSMNHPGIRAQLEKWEIENPYRDLVNREDIYLIDHDIERTLHYLRGNYYPNAKAEYIEELSSETGLPIYRITG